MGLSSDVGTGLGDSEEVSVGRVLGAGPLTWPASQGGFDGQEASQHPGLACRWGKDSDLSWETVRRPVEGSHWRNQL